MGFFVGCCSVMSKTLLLISLILALAIVAFGSKAHHARHGQSPFFRKLHQAEDDGLQFIDDDEAEADDDLGVVDDDYFFDDDDLTRIDDDDDGYDDDNDIVSFPPQTSDYESESSSSILAPATLLASFVAMIVF